jgi:16S rRNA (guanine527-N7)-methyltransferase
VPPILPSDEQRRLLERHLDELETWNRRLNLTAVPRARAWAKHVDESLTLLEAMAPAPGWRVVDIGAGAGIPGVVVAVVRPDLTVLLVEADRRKAGFLVHVAGLLDLENVTVAARRAEEVGRDPEHRAAYDAVISRAAAPPPLLVDLAVPLLRAGGSLWALVSDAPAAAAGMTTADVHGTAVGHGVLRVEKLPTTA